MAKIGSCWSNGRLIVKVVEKNSNMPGYNCLTWVKTKRDWTKKTSYYNIQNIGWYEFYNSAMTSKAE